MAIFGSPPLSTGLDDGFQERFRERSLRTVGRRSPSRNIAVVEPPVPDEMLVEMPLSRPPITRAAEAEPAFDAWLRTRANSRSFFSSAPRRRSGGHLRRRPAIRTGEARGWRLCAGRSDNGTAEFDASTPRPVGSKPVGNIRPVFVQRLGAFLRAFEMGACLQGDIINNVDGLGYDRLTRKVL